MTIKRPDYPSSARDFSEEARAMRNAARSPQQPSAYQEDAEELIARAMDFDVEQNSRLDTQKIILTLAERLKKEREARAVSAAIIRELNMAVARLQGKPSLWARFRGWLAKRLAP